MTQLVSSIYTERDGVMERDRERDGEMERDRERDGERGNI